MLRSLILGLVLLTAAPAAASPMASLVVPALEPAPGTPSGLKESSVRFAEFAGKRPFVLLYWNPGVRKSVEELKRFDALVAARKRALPDDKVLFFTATRVAGDDERAAVEAVVRELKPAAPVLIDANLSIATAMAAQFIPAYYGENAAGAIAVASYGSLAELVPLHGTLGAMLGAARDDLPIVVKAKPAPLAEGSLAPDFVLPALGGGDVRLKDVLAKGKRNTLLVFWSAFCSHCQRELPRIQAYLASRPEAYNVVSVTRMLNPEDFTATADFTRKIGFTYPVLNDGGQVMLDYQIQGFPTWMVITPAGKILTIQSGERAGLEGLLQRYEAAAK